MSESTGKAADARLGYWQSRKSSLYYQAIYQIVSVVGDDARSVLDVGSHQTDYINWFDWIPQRTQLDLRFRRAAPEGVEQIETDFLQWTPPQTYDLVLCMQVLEHVPEVEAFCERLKAVACKLVISVPYKWSADAHKDHVHDPVDEAKVRDWMQRRPNHSLIIPEPFSRRRYIAYYDIEGGEKARIPHETSKALIAKHA